MIKDNNIRIESLDSVKQKELKVLRHHLKQIHREQDECFNTILNTIGVAYDDRNNFNFYRTKVIPIQKRMKFLNREEDSILNKIKAIQLE